MSKVHKVGAVSLAAFAIISAAYVTEPAYANAATPETDLSSLNITASDFRTEAGVRLVYKKLRQRAGDVCKIEDPELRRNRAQSFVACMDETMDFYVDMISNYRLSNFHKKERSQNQ